MLGVLVMEIAFAVSLVIVAIIAAFVALRIVDRRSKVVAINSEPEHPVFRSEQDAELLPALRQVDLENFNLADHSDDRSVLVNELLVESQRVSRKLELVSGVLREDVSTIAGLSDRIVRLQADIQSREEQIRDLDLRLAEQRNETIRVIEERGQLMDKVEGLEMELSRRSNTLEATKETLLSMENSYRELLAQNNSLKSDIAHLHEDIQASQARVTDLTYTVEQRDSDLLRVNMELAEARSDIVSERNRATLAESKVTRLMKQLDEVKTETENEIDRYRSERDLLKVKLEQTQDGLESIRQRLNDAERNRDRSVSQVEAMRSELAAYRAEMSTKASALESNNRELSSHVTVLERILEQYRMKPVTNPTTNADAARLRVVAARDGENS